MLDEFPLNRAEDTVFGNSFDCCYFVPIRLNGEYQTGFHWGIVQQHRAESAVSALARGLGSCESELMP